ncbi:MAG: twin-arginine translocase subunit TatC [Dissulfuribacterales bacterium]
MSSDLLLKLRRGLIETGIAIFVITMVNFWLFPASLAGFAGLFAQKLAFFGVMEPTMALLKFSIFIGIGITAPWLFFRTSQVIYSSFPIKKTEVIFFTCSALVLFYVGALFCLFITLPFAMKFLLGFASDSLQPVISVEKFVNFVVLFTVGFGLVFEVPLIITGLCYMGIFSPDMFARSRSYAILIIAIISAIITPTPDAFNMMMMAVPIYILYELGIVIGRIFYKKRSQRENV